jgi:hypothetical protein
MTTWRFCQYWRWRAVSCGRSLRITKPAASNVPGSQYPRIHPDLRIIFE